MSQSQQSIYLGTGELRKKRLQWLRRSAKNERMSVSQFIWHCVLLYHRTLNAGDPPPAPQDQRRADYLNQIPPPDTAA